jgi:DNA-binding transcriptional ArsR family regulator
MNSLPDRRRTESDSRRLGALANETRQQIVRILREQPGSVSEADLAERLAATSDSGDGTSDTVASLRIHLHHVHLPKLADGGLVERDREERTVAATDHPVYDSARVGGATSTDGRDSIASLPVDDSRREILAIVESENGALSRGALARELASRGANGRPPESLVDDIEVRLHHYHLPKLEADDFVEYDRDDATVARPDTSRRSAVTNTPSR